MRPCPRAPEEADTGRRGESANGYIILGNVCDAACGAYRVSRGAGAEARARGRTLG